MSFYTTVKTSHFHSLPWEGNAREPASLGAAQPRSAAPCVLTGGNLMGTTAQTSPGPGFLTDVSPFSTQSQGKKKKKAASNKVKQDSTKFNPFSHPDHTTDQSTEVANRFHPKLMLPETPPKP